MPKFGVSLTSDSRDVIYNSNTFIKQRRREEERKRGREESRREEYTE
jgi:hypothetical protein